MSYLQFGVPMSIADMERILALIYKADVPDLEAHEFLERMKVLFTTSINVAKTKNAELLAKHPLPSDIPSLE